MKALSEHAEQVALMQWTADMATIWPEIQLLFAVCNGARTSIGTARKLVASGLKKGVPDLFLPVARAGYHGLFIEMKAMRRGAKLSPEQASWRNWLRDQGYAHEVCHGALAAAAVLTGYLRS